MKIFKRIIPALLAATACLAAGSPATLTVLLRGETDAELAPHGSGNVYAPDVLRDGGGFRMWYGGQGKDGHDRIALAESADGERWTRKGVVLDIEGANHVNDPSVVKRDGVYFLFYTRTQRDVVDSIHVAVSKDGLKWEPRGPAIEPGRPGAWDSLSVGRPSVLHEEGRFRMWYDGRKDFLPGAPVRDVPTSPDSRRSVGHATSADGFHWTRHGTNPVFGQDAGGVDVKRIGPRLLMLFESREGTRIATSGDGLSWRDGGLLAGRSGAEVDAFGHVTPFLWLPPSGQEPRLFFGAAAAGSWDRNQLASLAVPRTLLDRIVRLEK